MNEEDKVKIYSNDYSDAIVEYNVSEELLKMFGNYTINQIDDKYAIVYFPLSNVLQNLGSSSGYYVIPKIFGILDTTSLEEMGVIKVQSVPYLGLQGQNVLLGFVDTGIDYTNPLFKNADNTTRIVSIWDQSIENPNASENTFFYGTEYNKDQINQALSSSDPFSVVPSKDENGHGTTLAGLAGGSRNEEKDFSGVVTLSEFIIVKCKQAKPSLMDFFKIPKNTLCFQENDIMTGVRYLYQTARKLKRPIAICIGIGTNQGSHDGRGTLAEMLNSLSNQVGTCITVAGGNEGNSGHHFSGSIDKAIGYSSVELRVGENEPGFSMELWGNIPGTYSIDITSPTGQFTPRIPIRLTDHREIRYLFEKTVINYDNLLIETESGDQLILLRFENPTTGIWKFNIYGSPVNTGFHIWLPMRNFISDSTFFLNPNPDTTITNPGNAAYALTVNPYDPSTQSIYTYSSRGFSRTNIVKPELTAPGVNVYSPLTNQNFGPKSGSSIAAALTTGVTAMLLEWGIVKGNDRNMDTIQVKKYLIRGVKRNPNLEYPNKEWGYGKLDIFGTFSSLKGET